MKGTAQFDGAVHDKANPAAGTVIPRRTTAAPYPLSFAQERLWFLEQLQPGTGLYNVPVRLRLHGELDVVALSRALSSILARHEVLRTTFVAVDGTPIQVIGENPEFDLPIIDLFPFPSGQRMEKLEEISLADSLRPFDLAHDLMMRAMLIRMAPADHVLMVTFHHIAFDGWSLGVLFRELSQYYEAYRASTTPNLSALPIQYADFSLWQREWLQGMLLQEQLGYWKAKLETPFASEQFPLDRPRSPQMSFAGAHTRVPLRAELIQQLKALAHSERSSLFMVLLAALQVLLHGYNGQEDVIVGSPIANRTRVELEDLIGFFVNTLVLRTNVSGNLNFREVLARVRETALSAYDHQELPFEKLVQALHPERSPSHVPLFQVMFTCEDTPSVVEMAGLSVEVMIADTPLAKFDLLITVEFGKVVTVAARYNTAVFSPETIQRMLANYQTLLEAAVADPACPIEKLPMLTQSEQHRVLFEWNETQRDYPQMCVHQLFEAQAGSRPWAPALLFAGGQLTYGELNRRANALAGELQAVGVGPEARVGICAKRSPEFIISMLAVLKAGGAYVPLDPSYPPERLALMIEDSQIKVLLTTALSAQKLPITNASVIRFDVRDAPQSSENIVADVGPQNLAYVMYTSGSTGTPKGVEILHRGIVRLLMGVDYVRLSSEEVFLQLAPTSFDASTFEIWGALLYGAPLVLYPGTLPETRELGDVIRKYGITTVWLTASLFNAVIDEDPWVLRSVRQLLIGGEALSVAHVGRALAMLPDTQIINGYGPVESTTFACCYPIPRSTELGGSVPIGRPIENTQVYILNRCMRPVPIGAVGELCIGGDGLARGYQNAPEITLEKFVSNPFGAGRLYRTGDLARFRADGLIEFIARADDQVKIRGFRIEPGEIESTLCWHAGVAAAAVIVREDIPGERMLVAYVVPRDQALTVDTLFLFLKQKLPSYLLPARIVFLDKIPLTPNGKTDRRALPAPQCPDAATVPVSPRDDVEARLVKIWGTVLGKRTVGIRDNFFDLGGHSLLAAKLLARVQQSFGKTLCMASLFQAPTIENMALLLRDGTVEAPPIVPIQPSGKQATFFCVCGGPLFHPLAQRLGNDQPVVGLGLNAADLAGITAPVRVEDLAHRLAVKLRQIQPVGPYFLGGWCLEGVLAYELAQQLRAMGESVAALVMFDVANPAHARGSSVRERLSIQVQLWGHKIRFHIGNLYQLNSGDRRAYVVGRLQELRAKLQRAAWRAAYRLQLVRAGGTQVSVASSVSRLLYLASTTYEPTYYPGYVLFFQGKHRPAGEYRDLRRGWEKILTNLEVHELPGDHISMFYEPNVETLASILSARLGNARSELAPQGCAASTSST